MKTECKRIVSDQPASQKLVVFQSVEFSLCIARLISDTFLRNKTRALLVLRQNTFPTIV